RENNRFNDTLARIEQQAPDAERQIIQKIRTAQEEAMTVVADIAIIVRDGKIDAATELQLTREDPLYRSIDDLVRVVAQHEDERMASLRASIQSANRRSIVVMGAFAVVSVVLALVGGFVISWAFILPVRAADAFLSDVAAGKFAGVVEVPNRDEFGALATRLNETARELARLDAEQRLTADTLRARLAALDCGRQGRRARDRDRAESAGRLRRCQATHAVPAQSRGQCAEVHAPWPCHGGCRAAGRPAAISRVRYRYRDSRRQARRGLRRVPPGRRDDHAQFRRHRPGAQHHEEVRRDARRPDLGRERARQGLDLLLHDSASGRARGDGMSNKTVLYVEDNEFNRKIVRQL